jgi:hypothetical protein
LWEIGGTLWKPSSPRGIFLIESLSQHPIRVREGIEVMTITDWIIQLSIFGVLALAVVGTVQNLVDAMKKRN